MATSQGGYPPGAHPQDGYDQQQGHQYEEDAYQTSASQPNAQPTSGAPVSAASHGGRKKRTYAGQAYEFGAGPNAALGGQLQGGGSFGYSTPPQPQGYPQAVYGDQAQSVPQTFSQPEQVAVSGYQPPSAAHPQQPATSVGQMTQQFGQVGVGDQQQGQQQQPTAQRAHPLNQLYPTDLLTNAFNVAELDFPPPPIILPPNVSA
jgi:protein transport protein SEC24